MRMDTAVLVEKVMTVLQRTKQHFEVDRSYQGFVRPFITIARDPGSGGRPIAYALAEKLGWECIDEELITEVAQSTKKRKEVIARVDEKGRSLITDMVRSLFDEDYVDDMRYLKELAKVVLSYAHKGHVVILGRGANFITPHAKGLHVSITAPYEVRVQRAMDFEGFNQQMAKQVIARVDEERKRFVEQYLLRNVKNRNAYDLTLNTTHFSIEEAREVIITALKSKFN